MNRLTLFLLLGAIVGCAPRLSIVHEDPTYEFVMVQVDGETRGFVEYGGALALRVPRGFHRVAAIPRGETANPWCEDEDEWMFYVDRKAEITLLPELSE